MLKNLTATIFVAMLVSCSSTPRELSTPQQDFWRWFQANENRLFEFDRERDKKMRELELELHKVNPGLTFEVASEHNGIREFVISADGIKDVFPAVIALAEAAPNLSRWKITKFRPKQTVMKVKYEGLEVSPEQVEYTIEPEDDKVAITLFMDGYNKSDHKIFGTIGFLLLDQALGEFDVEKKVGTVEFKSRSGQTNLPKQPLSSLSQNVDRIVSTTSR
jgi:hypothetical protein